MKCTICHHPQRRAIDLALLSRRHTFESLHRQFGVSVSALFRHRKHLKENVIDARDRLERTKRQGCLLKLTDLLEHVQQAVRTAEAEGSLDRVIRGAYVASRIIQQIDRLEVSLELEAVYRLISAPGFVSQDTLLPTDPQVMGELHQAVVDTACAPCPEPPPAVSADDACEDEDDGHQDAPAKSYSFSSAAYQAIVNPLREIRNSELETPSACDPCPEPLPEVSGDADDEDASDGDHAPAAGPTPVEAFPETPNPLPKTPPSRRAAVLEVLRLFQRQYPHLDFSPDVLADPEIDPKIKRKITEKLPKKMALLVGKIIKSREDTQCEKNLPKNPPYAPNPDLSAEPPPQHPLAERPFDLSSAPPETRAPRSAVG